MDTSLSIHTLHVLSSCSLLNCSSIGKSETFSVGMYFMSCCTKGAKAKALLLQIRLTIFSHRIYIFKLTVWTLPKHYK